jgi:hypothetical protein
MAESTNDGSAKIILGVIALIIGVIVGYFVYTKYLQGKLGNIGSNTNTTDPTPTRHPQQRQQRTRAIVVHHKDAVT